MATIEQMNPKPRMLDMQPGHWVNEGFELRRQVYTFKGQERRLILPFSAINIQLRRVGLL